MGLAANDFHGLEIDLRRFDGAKALRVVHPANQSIAEHRHDWPCLTLHMLGSYIENFDDGELRIDGPAGVLHPPGGTHANRIGEYGLETVSIQFDPAWVGWEVPTKMGARPLAWRSGLAAAQARNLSLAWSNTLVDEDHLKGALNAFLSIAGTEQCPAPRWLSAVDRMLSDDLALSTLEIARRLVLHPAWLSRAYRSARGEGLQETRRRKCVARATHLLRTAADPLADIALAAGFCDQSHMNRSLRAVINRTPLQIREEGVRLARIDDVIE